MSVRPFLDKSPVLGARVYIDPQACVMGDVTLEEDVSVFPMAVIRGDMHFISIGARSKIQANYVLHITHPSPQTHPDGFPLIIGSDVTFGHGAILHGCRLEGRALIGMHATVLDGALIPTDVIIGANSLVPAHKKLESGFLYVGSPVLQKRPLTEAERAYILYSAQNYVRLKDRYQASC